MLILNFIYTHYIPIILVCLPSLVCLILAFIYKNSYRYTNYSDFTKFPCTLKGIVTKVGDGDGFKMVHTPFFRSSDVKNIPSNSIRLAGIDAPEVRCFDKPAQPLATEAKDYLKNMILNKQIYVKVIKLDLYKRALVIAYVKKNMLQWTNINLEIIKSGYACVFDSRYGSFGGMETGFRDAEKAAKSNKLGIWKIDGFTLPMEYKKKFKK